VYMLNIVMLVTQLPCVLKDENFEEKRTWRNNVDDGTELKEDCRHLRQLRP
jgi:hypothetical protein